MSRFTSRSKARIFGSRRRTRLRVALALCGLWGVSAAAVPADSLADSSADNAGADPGARYVSVTFELHGLEESAAVLNEAVGRLSQTVDQVAASPETLSPEQLAAFADLADRTTGVVEAFRQTMNELEPTLQRARQPEISTSA